MESLSKKIELPPTHPFFRVNSLLYELRQNLGETLFLEKANSLEIAINELFHYFDKKEEEFKKLTRKVKLIELEKTESNKESKKFKKLGKTFLFKRKIKNYGSRRRTPSDDKHFGRKRQKICNSLFFYPLKLHFF